MEGATQPYLPMANDTHEIDAHSQFHFQSIEAIDGTENLIMCEGLDSVDTNEVGVNILDIIGVAQGSSETDTLNRGDCYADDNAQELILEKVFATQQDAYDFYNHYALSKGFGIRKCYTNKSMVTNKIYRRLFVCNKAGFKSVKDNEPNGKEKKCRWETRVGCEAMMQVKVSKSGEWAVEKFYDIHNHPLLTPSKAIKFRSHSTFHRTITCKALISELNQVGLRPSQITRAVNVITGTQEGDITARQCTGILSNERKNNVGQECYGIIKHFQDKAVSDGTHYFAVDLAKDGSLRSVFWVDGRSRASYALFGDVLVFDVTYKTNKFRMPFSPFVGVNHHRQSILFGAALLEDETEETFVWLFEQFLRWMFDKPPAAIITDQDGAMRNAIARVFPNTRHRFCMWHINKHVMEHLQPFRSRYSDFNDCYTKWVKSETVEEFECGWITLKEKYEIQEKSWLSNMYNLRQHWVKAYLKDTFFAGMTTSGRSESIHSFFDGYVNSNTMLNEFVVQYDKAVHSQRCAEEDEDFRTMNSKAVFLTGHPIEVRAGECYTCNLFEIFKKEWLASFDCLHEKLSKEDGKSKYRVGLLVQDRCKWKIVVYHGGVTVSCRCTKFETEGILCKHILYIMRKKTLTTLPEHCILRRWTIEARYKVGNVGCGLKETNNEVTPLALWSVRAKFSKAIEDARKSPSAIAKLDTWLDGFLEEQSVNGNVNQMVGDDMRSQVASNANISHVEAMHQISIRDPAAPFKTKGRPKIATRLKSGIELTTEAKKQRTCSLCLGKGHNRTGCPQAKLTARKGNMSGQNATQ